MGAGATDPARSAVLRLRIAGMAFDLRSEDETLTLAGAGATARFVAPAAADPEPAERVSIRVRWADSDEEPAVSPESLIFDSGNVWRLYRQGEGYACAFTSPTRGERPYKTATFDLSFMRGEVRLRRDCFAESSPVYPLEYPLDELLMVQLLGRGRGAEIHGCGVVTPEGQGLLFVGQSGAGKTTTARLWERAGVTRILSDDRIILREQGSRIVMHGTPWHGEAGLSLAESAPLDRIFLLRQGPENAWAPLPAAAATARLMACGFLPFHDRECLAFSLAFLEGVAARVPVGEFTFTRDDRAVAAARRVAKGAAPACVRWECDR